MRFGAILPRFESALQGILAALAAAAQPSLVSVMVALGILSPCHPAQAVTVPVEAARAAIMIRRLGLGD